MRIKQSENKHQWFIIESIKGVDKIAKVFYSKEKATEYLQQRK